MSPISYFEDFRPMLPLLTFLGVMSLVTMAVYGYDKWAARNKAWRVPEVIMLALALGGGALGAIIAMAVFHHKTHHNSFRVMVPLALVIWLVVLYNKVPL